MLKRNYFWKCVSWPATGAFPSVEPPNSHKTLFLGGLSFWNTFLFIILAANLLYRYQRLKLVTPICNKLLLHFLFATTTHPTTAEKKHLAASYSMNCRCRRTSWRSNGLPFMMKSDGSGSKSSMWWSWEWEQIVWVRGSINKSSDHIPPCCTDVTFFPFR